MIKTGFIGNVSLSRQRGSSPTRSSSQRKKTFIIYLLLSVCVFSFRLLRGEKTKVISLSPILEDGPRSNHDSAPAGRHLGNGQDLMKNLDVIIICVSFY